MSINIELDLEEILTRLDMIIISNEFDSIEITERLDTMEQIIQSSIRNNILYNAWFINMLGFLSALLVAVIFAIIWRR